MTPAFCQGGMSCAATPLASASAQHPEDSQHRDCDDPNDDEPLHPLERMPSSHRALGDLVARRHPALHRIGRDGAREHDDIELNRRRSLVGLEEGVDPRAPRPLTLCHYVNGFSISLLLPLYCEERPHHPFASCHRGEPGLDLLRVPHQVLPA